MNHEETKKRIQELTGGMELSFGCEFLTHKGVYRYINACGPRKYRALSEDNMFDESLNIFIKEILGKPITLAVVMLAIATEYNPKNTSTFLNIDSNGEFCWTTTTDLRGGTMKIIEPIIYWNLSKDNFNDQSEETKTFIGELIK